MATAVLRANAERSENRRKTRVGHRKTQFVEATFKQQTYPYRLNFYDSPPTADITLEQFEQWAIDRLRGMYALDSIQSRGW